jgi:hypothetical protein
MLYLQTAIIKNLRIIFSVSVLELNATVLHEVHSVGAKQRGSLQLEV